MDNARLILDDERRELQCTHPAPVKLRQQTFPPRRRHVQPPHHISLYQLFTGSRHKCHTRYAMKLMTPLNRGWCTPYVYLADGRLQIDSNLVENAIRLTAIGKKNWIFIGRAEASERSAIIYTLIESCCRRIDPMPI